MITKEAFENLDRIFGYKFNYEINDEKIEARSKNFIENDFLMNIEKTDFFRFISDGSFGYKLGDPEPTKKFTVKQLRRRGVAGLFKTTPIF